MRSADKQPYLQHSRDVSPEHIQKKPQQIKLSNKLKNNLMIDANATFVAGEGIRSNSGIGANFKGIVSPLATNGNGFGNLHLFNTTLQGNSVLQPMTMKHQAIR